MRFPSNQKSNYLKQGKENNSMKGFIVIFLIISTTSMISKSQQVWYVDDVLTNGNGSSASPFNNINDGLTNAMPGDTIVVKPGNYSQEITTVRNGSISARITIKAFNPNNRPVLSRSGRVFKINNDFITIDGLVLHGQYGSSDIMQIDEAHNVSVKNCEIKEGKRDGLDIYNSNNCLIDNCEIHHVLNGTYTNQADAHCIVAAGQKNLTVRNCNLYYCSGDCFQSDPNRTLPLWDSIVIENCKLWTGPLPTDAAGFNAGEIPGENAVDTKICADSLSYGYRPKILLTNIEAYGFINNSFINNRAAFNIKENVKCIMNRIKVYNNEISFRLRGPGSRGGAHVTIKNSIAYDNEKVFRIEDNIELLHIYNSTFHKDNHYDYIQLAGGGYDASGFEMKNCLFMGSKPTDASHSSNITANSSFFINATNNDYHLVDGSSPIDAGVAIAEVTDDFDGNLRPVGLNYDIGAFEYDPNVSVFENNDFSFSVFPNPATNKIVVRVNNYENSQINIKIADVRGRTLFISDFIFSHTKPEQKIDISRFNDGIYFLLIKQDDVCETKKIIKNSF